MHVKPKREASGYKPTSVQFHSPRTGAVGSCASISPPLACYGLSSIEFVSDFHPELVSTASLNFA
jgi:hypothetical protein